MNPIIRTFAAAAFMGGLAVASQAAADGQSCGGPSNLQCSAGQYCNKSADACHRSTAAGSCQPLAQMCNELYQPVCGCDGKTYANACHAAQKGVSVASAGACAVPASPSNPGG